MRSIAIRYERGRSRIWLFPIRTLLAVHAFPIVHSRLYVLITKTIQNNASESDTSSYVSLCLSLCLSLSLCVSLCLCISVFPSVYIFPGRWHLILGEDDVERRICTKFFISACGLSVFASVGTNYLPLIINFIHNLRLPPHYASVQLSIDSYDDLFHSITYSWPAMCLHSHAPST